MLKNIVYLNKRAVNSLPLLSFIFIIVCSDAVKADDQPGVGNVTLAENTINQYLDEIHRLEVTYGPHYEAIGEYLISLSRLYETQGDKLKKHTSLKQALQIYRLNYGLHSKAQLPILEQLIANNIDLQDWEALDRDYDYLYWIHRRIHGVNSLELLPVLNRVLEWKLRVVKEGLFGNPDIMNLQVIKLLRKDKKIRNLHLGESSPLLKRTVFY